MALYSKQLYLASGRAIFFGWLSLALSVALGMSLILRGYPNTGMSLQMTMIFLVAYLIGIKIPKTLSQDKIYLYGILISIPVGAVLLFLVYRLSGEPRIHAVYLWVMGISLFASLGVCGSFIKERDELMDAANP